jgi:hypothetical protein
MITSIWPSIKSRWAEAQNGALSGDGRGSRACLRWKRSDSAVHAGVHAHNLKGVHFAGRTTGLDRRATNEWPPPRDEGVMKIAGGLNQEFSLIRGLFPIIHRNRLRLCTREFPRTDVRLTVRLVSS